VIEVEVVGGMVATGREFFSGHHQHSCSVLLGVREGKKLSVSDWLELPGISKAAGVRMREADTLKSCDANPRPAGLQHLSPGFPGAVVGCFWFLIQV